MIKRFLVIGVFFLLIVSSIGSLSFGNNVEVNEKETLFENYGHDRYFYPEFYDCYNASEITCYGPISGYESNDFIDIESEKISISKDTAKPLNGPPMDSAWPMKCHDLHHTGLSPYSTAVNPGIEKWRFKTRYGLDGSPVIDNNGTIYFGAKDGYIYALYPNGTMKWRYETDNWITSAPAVDKDGTIYIGSWDTNLYAIYPNGTLKWKSPGTGGSIASSPAIGNDGTVYIGNYASRLVAVNPNGTIKWYYNLDDDTTSDPCVGDDGTIYIGSFDSYFYAVYPNGTLKWRFKTGDKIYGSASIADDGTVYIGSSWDSYLYAVYPNNGTMIWRYGGAGTPNNPSIGCDGTIYAGYLYNLLALYPNSTLKWDFYVGNDRWIATSAPAISADGTIYFGVNIGDSAGGEIIAVNSDGTEKWRKKIAEWWIRSSPAIAEDGTVYIGSTCEGRGYLHAFGSVESNSPPEAPTISGETNGKVGEEYEFRLQAFDPDNNPVSYYIEWGDGSTTGWTFERASGEIYYYDHTWSEKGNYTIRAKARDTLNEESNWTEFEIKITNPRNKTLNIYYWIRLLERFPLLQKILNFLTI
jgi:outer membrane protein assembly factor BamB